VYPWQAARASDELEPAERLAHDVLTARPDLLPSVERIMSAGLDSNETLRAISLFRDSLSNIGDEHRDPAVAIERSRGVTE
jgi:hypothetical protein